MAASRGGRGAPDEVAGELVVAAVAEDELDLVARGEAVEVGHAEAAGGVAGAGAFDVDDLVDGGRHFAEGAFAAGLHHEGVAAVLEQAVHEGKEFAGVEHGLAAGELNERAGEGLDLRDNLIFSERLAAVEGVGGVAPAAAQVAAGEAHKDARHAGKGAFALDGFIEFDEAHG